MKTYLVTSLRSNFGIRKRKLAKKNILASKPWKMYQEI